jgi:hypothetical protein
MSHELTHKRGGQAETTHRARKGATRDSACFHRRDELSQLLLIHRNTSAGLPVMTPLPRANATSPRDDVLARAITAGPSRLRW